MRLFNSTSIRFNSTDLICMLYAIYALREVGFAFDRDEYSSMGHLFSLMLPPIAVFAGIAYLFRIRYLTLEKNHIYLLILPILFAFMSIHSYTGSPGSFLHAIPMLLFLLMRTDDRINIFDYFYWLIQLNNIISLYLYICYRFSINIGFEMVPRYGTLIPVFYQKWFIFAIHETGNFLGGRLCGVFNEPGPLGTICALLYIARYRYSERWEKILLIATILCTFSLAGILLLFLFIFVRKLQYNARYIFVLIFGGILFLSIPYIDFGNEQLNILASRFAIVDGKWVGYNRTNALFDQKFREFLSEGPVLIGYGAGYNFQGNIIQASYKQIILEYGFLGFVLLLAFWIIIPLRVSKRNWDCILLLFFFMLSIYGRPRQIMQIFGYVLLFGGIDWIQWKYLQHARKMNLLSIKGGADNIEQKSIRDCTKEACS